MHFCCSLSSAEALSIWRVIIAPGVISTVIIPIYSLVEPSQGEGGTFITRLRESATFWPEDSWRTEQNAVLWHCRDLLCLRHDKWVLAAKHAIAHSIPILSTYYPSAEYHQRDEFHLWDDFYNLRWQLNVSTTYKSSIQVENPQRNKNTFQSAIFISRSPIMSRVALAQATQLQSLKIPPPMQHHATLPSGDSSKM